MLFRHPRAQMWTIWSLVVIFAVIQAVAWTLAGGIPRRPLVLVQVIAAWLVMLVLATIATRRIRELQRSLNQQEQVHRATLDEVEQLQTQNAILQIIAHSVDVPLAFQALAGRIARIVKCDRLGLALLSEDGVEFQTYTARVQDEERRMRPRPEVTFKVETTAIGFVVRSREPLILNDISEAAPEFLDANVLRSSGFAAALIMPLVSKERAIGTLNAVSRHKDVFAQAHVEALRPIAEIFAVACVAQQLQMMLGRYRTMAAVSDFTVSIAADMNGALQTIVGHCDLIERVYPDPELQRDLATIVRQVQRIAELLEKMRAAANERLKQAADSIQDTGLPSSSDTLRGKEIT